MGVAGLDPDKIAPTVGLNSKELLDYEKGQGKNSEFCF